MSEPKTPYLQAPPAQNRILAALPSDEYSRLLPDLARVTLPQGKVLWEVGDLTHYAFFLLNGMVSLLSVTEDGSSVEVSMIGSEGIVGVNSILRFNTIPYRGVVQVPASAMRITVDSLGREFARGGRLQDILLRYTHTFLTEISQSASCNRFHTTEERLCRYLLTSGDRARSNSLQLTQEFLSQMIGCPRTSVTATCIRLQKIGIINCRRGKIKIINRHDLETFSCECYGVITEAINRYMVA